MQVNKAIGECSAEYNGEYYLIRPCFRALKQIDDLSDAIYDVCRAYNKLLNEVKSSVYEISICAYVVQQCSNLTDDMIGYCKESNGKPKWVQKVLTVQEIIIMAHHCIKWGVFGEPKPLTQRAKEQLAKKPNKPFNPSEFVAVLIDEFGVSKSDAWESTMVEFQMLCDRRQEKNQGDKPDLPNDEERKAASEHYQACIKRKQELNK